MSALIRFTIDEDAKAQATLICNKLGIDLQAYLRMCISRLISNNGIHFDMVLNNESSKGVRSILEMGRISKENGNSEMSLDEINDEIKKTREKMN